MVFQKEVLRLPEMVWKSLIPVKALARFRKSLSYKKEDLPPLPEPTVRQRFSDLGREWSETARGATRHEEAATNGATRPEEVAQAAQVKGLPDLDHARHLLAVSAEVSAAIIKKAIGRGVRDLERPRF